MVATLTDAEMARLTGLVVGCVRSVAVRFSIWQLGRLRASRMGEVDELPEEAKTTIESSLPTDPNELLSEEQRSSLSSDLAKLARLRREAEASSATLRLT